MRERERERERERKREDWVQVTFSVILSNVILSNNLLLNSYFENPTNRLHILCIFLICM